MSAIFDELRAALWSVWNRRWLALGVAWGLCLAGWLAVAFFPNSYESRARIFVQLDDVLSEQIGIGAATRERDIERVTQTLTSSVNLEKVIRSTRLGANLTTQREMETAIEALKESIKISSKEKDLFEITAEIGRSDLSDGENAMLAREVVQKLIDIFREENLGGSRSDMRETIEFLDQQLAQRQQELEGAEQRRLAFEAEHPELAGGAAGISMNLASTRAESRSVDADLAAAQSALASIEGQLASTQRTLPGGGGPQGTLMLAEASLADMQARGLTDSHPDVVTIERQIATLRRQVNSQGSNAGGIPNPAYSALLSIRAERQANVQSLRSRSAALRSEISQMVANQSMEPGAAAEAQRISRDYDVLREQYDKLLKDREELRLRGQVQTERSSVKFDVIDPPTTPRVPSAPNRPLLLLGVLLAGIGVGGGAGWAMSQLRASFATAGKLETIFELPVIGTISTVMTDANRAIQRKRRRQFIAGAGGLCSLFVVMLAVEFVQRGMVA